MKTIAVAIAALFLSLSAKAQVSGNIVGFYRLEIFPGNFLIANQLSNHTNTLNTIFNGDIPVGTSFTMWDAAAQHFTPLSTYSGSNSGWTINYTLNFGEGGLLTSSFDWQTTIVGEVISNFVDGVGLVNWHPNYSSGLHLISSPIPITAPMDSMFTNVVGRLPQDGEWAAILNPTNQTYTFTTFHTGSGWDNGDPILGYGQSAWFDLGGGLPATLSSLPMVPEPGAVALGILGVGLLFVRRARTGRHSYKAAAPVT
jgi:hypothetical protein